MLGVALSLAALVFNTAAGRLQRADRPLAAARGAAPPEFQRGLLATVMVALAVRLLAASIAPQRDLNMLNIWGRISSINVRKVVWCAQELGLDFQRTEAGGQFGVVQTPEYLALNPERAGAADRRRRRLRTLWESNVIVRYLCAKHSPGKLYPEPTCRSASTPSAGWTGSRPRSTRPAATPSSQLDAHAAGAAQRGRDRALGARHRAAARHCSTRTWRTHAFMAGDRFTMADIPIACEMHRWFGLPQPQTRGPPGRTSSAGTPTCARRAGRARRARPRTPGNLKAPMKTRPFKQVDVFTAEPYLGNPLAVVLDGSGLDDAADAALRATGPTCRKPPSCCRPPSRRPTTACASSRPAASCPSPATRRWAAATPGWRPAASRKARTSSCRSARSGLVKIRREGERLAFAAPPLKRSAPSPLAAGPGRRPRWA